MLHKCNRLFLALLLVCLPLAFAACSQTDSAPSPDLSVPYVCTAVWPKNAYTAQLFPPEDGTVVSVREFSASGRYEIQMTGVSRDTAEAYVQALADSGCYLTADAANDVSAGTLLQKSGASVSISHSGESLGILITLAADAGTD